jgi:Zn finger protein HypA/HybF involved in hydrogenase expression
MTFQCPKCNINLSDDEYLNLSGRHTKENYLIKCPHCSQESFSIQSDKPYWKRLEGMEDEIELELESVHPEYN